MQYLVWHIHRSLPPHFLDTAKLSNGKKYGQKHRYRNLLTWWFVFIKSYATVFYPEKARYGRLHWDVLNLKHVHFLLIWIIIHLYWWWTETWLSSKVICISVIMIFRIIYWLCITVFIYFLSRTLRKNFRLSV